jgi:hypothetical protein
MLVVLPGKVTVAETSVTKVIVIRPAFPVSDGRPWVGTRDALAVSICIEGARKRALIATHYAGCEIPLRITVRLIRIDGRDENAVLHIKVEGSTRLIRVPRSTKYWRKRKTGCREQKESCRKDTGDELFHFFPLENA